MRVTSIQDDIRALGIEIIWVLEYTVSGVGGTADSCFDFFTTGGATEGWCVGDSQTMPTPYTFDDAPFAIGRFVYNSNLHRFRNTYWLSICAFWSLPL